jgi:hypothetical protein
MYLTVLIPKSFIFHNTAFKVSALVLFLFLLLPGIGHSQVQPTISFQGVLKKANGEAVPDGEYNFVFSFWKSLSGTANSDKLLKIGQTDPNNASNQWTEEVTLAVAGGIYSHFLGSITPLNPLNFNGSVYLNVKVSGKDLVPRTQFTYAPFAFAVETAQKVVCSGAVGDVKYSILPPDKFKDVNGDCWVPMDGRTLNSGDKLQQVTGMSSIPNAGGLFLRAQDFAIVSGSEAWKPKSASDNDPDRSETSAIGFQTDEFRWHQHSGQTADAGWHAHGYKDKWFNEQSNGNQGFGGSGDTDYDNSNPVTNSSYQNDRTTDGAGVHSHSFTTWGTGHHETRPKNLNLWIYIRIN